MLATLDALIQNGTGGRHTLVLRQMCSLFTKISDSNEGGATTLFDEIMANLAIDLDDTVVTILAPELHQFSGLLPVFKSTMSSRAFEIEARTEKRPAYPETLALQVPEPVADEAADLQPVNLLPQTPVEASADESAVDAAANVAAYNAVKNESPVKVSPTDDQPENADTEWKDESRAPDTIATAPSEALVVSDAPAEATRPVVDRRATPRDPAVEANNPIALARRCAPAELLMIASVAHLPETLTGVIVMRGDRHAIVCALQNRTARFSRSSLTTLAELAPSDQMIKQAMVKRDDLPELIIERMLPYLNPEAKARLLISGAPFNELSALRALEQANADLVNSYRQGQQLKGLDSFVSAVEDNRMTSEEVVIALAAEMRVAELAMFAARRIGLSLATAMNLLAGRLDKAAAVLAAALQCERRATTAIMDMRRRCGAMSDARGAIEVFLRINTDEALMLVRQIESLSAEIEPLQDDVAPVEHQEMAA